MRTWLLVVVRNRAIDHVRRSVVRDRPLVSDEGLAERVAAKECTDVEAVRALGLELALDQVETRHGLD